MSLGFSQGSLLSAASAYTAQGVNFDGSTTVANDGTAAFTGVTNGASILFSFWLKQGGSDGVEQRIYDGGQFRISRGSDNKILVLTENASFQSSYATNAVSTLVAGGGWHHFMGSGNGTTGTFYRDGATDGTPTIANNTINFDATGQKQVSQTFVRYTGDLADLYINLNTYMDLTVAGNRAKFFSAGGAPVDLGSDGSTPTGSAPTLYMHGAVATWHVNDGAGGDIFTVTSGALTAASTNPP